MSEADLLGANLTGARYVEEDLKGALHVATARRPHVERTE